MVNMLETVNLFICRFFSLSKKWKNTKFYLLSGYKGINGMDPPSPINSSIAEDVWSKGMFTYFNTMNQSTTDDENKIINVNLGYRVYGKKAMEPGPGGDGGVNGFGGNPGYILISGSENKVIVNMTEGKNFSKMKKTHFISRVPLQGKEAT